MVPELGRDIADHDPPVGIELPGRELSPWQSGADRIPPGFACRLLDREIGIREKVQKIDLPRDQLRLVRRDCEGGVEMFDRSRDLAWLAKQELSSANAIAERGFSSSNAVQARIACAVFPMLSATSAFPRRATSSFGDSASAASKSAAACSGRDSARLSRPRCARTFAELA